MYMYIYIYIYIHICICIYIYIYIYTYMYNICPGPRRARGLRGHAAAGSGGAAVRSAIHV